MDPQQNQMAPEKKSFGPLIGIIVIIIVILVGGLYFWGNMSSETPSESSAVTEDTSSMDSIEADLGASVPSGSSDFSDIEAELNQ